MSLSARSGTKYAEKRRHKRFSVSGHLQGRLLTSRGGAALTFMLIDASKHGLGLIIDESVQSGDALELHLDEQISGSLLLQVSWVQPTEVDLGQESMYRCGLALMNESLDLEQILRSIDTVMLEDLD